jgi:two-component system, OmpR family, phosphate regulon sensor histidine kinase PhoR
MGGMVGVGIILGLLVAAGIGAIAGVLVYHRWLNHQIRRITVKLQSKPSRSSLSAWAQLKRAVARQRSKQRGLERQVESWEAIAQAVPLGFLRVDRHNQLIGCNSCARQLLGLSWHPNLPLRLLLEWVRSYELDALIEQTRTLQRPSSADWTWYPVSTDATGHQAPIPIRGYGIPLRSQGVAVLLEDRREAMQLTQQRDRWSSDVAHELKTPLTSLRLVAEMLQMRLTGSDRDWVNKLLGEILRLDHLVQDLLDLGRLENQPNQNFQPVDLVEIVWAAWLCLDPLASQKQITLSYTGPAQNLIHGDRARLHRALLNLLDNALKYSPPQGAIQVYLRVEAEETCLSVMDEGPGFAPEDLPFVFERFYRGDAARTRQVISAPPSGDMAAAEPNRSLSAPLPATPLPNGSGLGLAIVRQIVEAHQGRVEAGNWSDGPASPLRGGKVSLCFAASVEKA